MVATREEREFSISCSLRAETSEIFCRGSILRYPMRYLKLRSESLGFSSGGHTLGYW
jgi:hypothetical protein